MPWGNPKDGSHDAKPRLSEVDKAGKVGRKLTIIRLSGALVQVVISDLIPLRESAWVCKQVAFRPKCFHRYCTLEVHPAWNWAVISWERNPPCVIAA